MSHLLFFCYCLRFWRQLLSYFVRLNVEGIRQQHKALVNGWHVYRSRE